MIEMVLHEVYVVQFSHHMNRTIVVVLKAQRRNRYLSIHGPYNHAHSFVAQLRGEPWGQLLYSPERTTVDESVIKYFKIKRCNDAFNIFMRGTVKGLDDIAMQNESLGVSAIAGALRRNLPIYADEDVLDEFGVDNPTEFNQTIKSVQPLDRSKRKRED